ncbi:MAG: MFS transporter [Lachnospiraceae bacterium]
MATLLLVIIYVCYISLGVPDSLLGTAWPAIYEELDLPISYVSIVSMLISGETVISSLLSAQLVARLGTEKITAISTSLTAIALFGFSCSHNLFWLCLCAIPLGIGAGSIDTALNNYVALHYNAMQMSFLHCFYGIGVSLSPYLMSLALSENMNWRKGYRTVFFIQMTIAVISIIALPLWKKIQTAQIDEEKMFRVLAFGEMLRNRKITACCGVFVGISALESTCLIWGSTFLVEAKELSADTAAKMITFYFVGMAIGRLLSGLLTVHFSSWQIIGVSLGTILLAILFLLYPFGYITAVVGLFLIGLGNGPIFPNMTYLTPKLFGEEVSQSVIGIQIAFSYLSIMLAPAFFGVLAQNMGICCFVPFLGVTFIMMTGMIIYVKCIKS